MATTILPATQGSTMAQQQVPATHLFTCNTCQVAFRTSDLQRSHMQTDWHRYNLKRKVATLPPLTSEVFTEKVLANQANAAVSAAKATFKKDCSACQKMYYSENAYRNHLASQRHRTLAARAAANGHADAETSSVMSSTFSLGEPLETQSTRSHADSVPTKISTAEAMEVDATGKEASQDDDEEINEHTLSRCLFCNHQSEDIDVNESHMSRAHGMFLPEKDYLVDRDGLLTFLYQRIFELHECLYCAQIKHSTAAVQGHMRDKGHCMIPYSTEEDMLDVGDYYDFSSTYEDKGSAGQDDGKDGGVKLGATRATIVTVENAEGEEVDAADGDDDGWESDASSLSSVPTDEITAVPIDDHSHRYKLLDKHRHHSHRDPRPHRNHDGYHSHAHTTPHAVYHDDYEMHLPSGRVAGHRSLNVYYRQAVRPIRSDDDERGRQRAIDGRHGSDEETQIARYKGHDLARQLIARATGGAGMVGVSEDKKRFVLNAEKRTQRRAERAANRYQAGNERRGNFQKHFRDPLLQ